MLCLLGNRSEERREGRKRRGERKGEEREEALCFLFWVTSNAEAMALQDVSRQPAPQRVVWEH